MDIGFQSLFSKMPFSGYEFPAKQSCILQVSYFVSLQNCLVRVSFPLAVGGLEGLCFASRPAGLGAACCLA